MRLSAGLSLLLALRVLGGLRSSFGARSLHSSVDREHDDRADDGSDNPAGTDIEPISPEPAKDRATDERANRADDERESPVDSAPITKDNLGKPASSETNCEQHQDEKHGRTLADDCRIAALGSVDAAGVDEPAIPRLGTEDSVGRDTAIRLELLDCDDGLQVVHTRHWSRLVTQFWQVLL